MSWLQRVGDRACALSPDKAQAAAVVEAFRLVAEEWACSDVAAGAPFPSGITSEGFPVELSLRQSPVRGGDLRFIAQPGHADVPLALDRPFLKRRAIAFAAAYAGIEAASYAAAALEFFPSDDTADIGNFFLWLGLELHGTTPSVVKLYLNPWACAADERGLPVAERLLAMAGFGSLVPAMEALVAMQVPARPHIIGINLDTLGARSIKMYFPLRNASLPSLLAMVAAFPGSQPVSDALQRLSGCLSRPVGEVHAALAWSRGVAEPRFRASLYCNDWFATDGAVLAAARAVSRAASSRPPAWSAVRQRWFTFLGIEGDSATLYSHV
jgi:hypothetical protein